MKWSLLNAITSLIITGWITIIVSTYNPINIELKLISLLLCGFLVIFSNKWVQDELK